MLRLAMDRHLCTYPTSELPRRVRAELCRLAAQSFATPAVFVERGLAHADHLVTEWSGSRVVSAMSYGSALFEAEGRRAAASFMGLGIVDQASRGSGAGTRMFERVSTLARRGAEELAHDADAALGFCWALVKSPISMIALRSKLPDLSPRSDGGFDLETEPYLPALRRHLGVSAPRPGDPLFVLRGVSGVRYLREARAELDEVSAHPGLFDMRALRLDPERGDRLLITFGRVAS